MVQLTGGTIQEAAMLPQQKLKLQPSLAAFSRAPGKLAKDIRRIVVMSTGYKYSYPHIHAHHIIIIHS